MLKKSKFLILIIAEIFFLTFLFIILPTIFIKERNGISQTSFENILTLDIKHTYLQSFTTDHNNLNSVSVLVKNPALKSTDQVKIELQNDSRNTIQVLNISGQGIGDPSWIRFKFPSVKSHYGDIFYIKVTSNAKQDNDLYIYGNQENQSLNFKTTYKSSTFKDSLKEEIIFQKVKLSKLSKIPTFVYLVMLIVTNILLFLSL